MSELSPLFTSPLVRVFDSLCTSGRSGCTCSRGGEEPHLVLVRRGCFAYHKGSQVHVGDACTALFHDYGVEYRLSHPGDTGDDCTVLDLSPEALDEALWRTGAGRVEFSLDPDAQLTHHRAYAAFSGPGLDALDGEEIALSLVRLLSPATDIATTAPRDHAVVAAAKATINDRLGESLSLAELAQAARCSPFHLMRVFRRETGQSLRGYRARLRIGAALDRLASGEDDIAGLAVELGFSSHSHLSDTFRKVLGASPSAVRLSLHPSRRFSEAAKAEVA